MSRCRLASLGLALLTAVAAPAAAAETWTTRVTVRVYDATGGQQDWTTAFELAASIVSAASVEIVWIHCNESPRHAVHLRCGRRLAAGELVLRIVRAPVPADYRGGLPLGHALIDMEKGVGTLATVYLDRVQWVARDTGADAGVLLGRAVAHEIGHLLMASNTHGPGGLMRPVWARDELLRRHEADWTFHPAEISAIRSRRIGAAR